MSDLLTRIIKISSFLLTPLLGYVVGQKYNNYNYTSFSLVFAGFYLGTILGYIIFRFIYRYGQDTLTIFGSIIFAVFGLECLLLNNQTMYIIMSVFSGFGFSIFTLSNDQRLLLNNNNINKFIKLRFVLFFTIIGITIMALIVKINNQYNLFISLLCGFCIYFVTFRMRLFGYGNKYLKSSTIGLISSIWIIYISQDIIILSIGWLIFFATIGCFLYDRFAIFNNNNTLNLEMALGFIAAGIFVSIFPPEYIWQICFMWACIFVIYDLFTKTTHVL